MSALAEAPFTPFSLEMPSGRIIESARPADAEPICMIRLAGRVASLANAKIGLPKERLRNVLYGPNNENVGPGIANWVQWIEGRNEEEEVLVSRRGEAVEGVVWPCMENNVRWLTNLYVAKPGEGTGSDLIEATKIWHGDQSRKLLVARDNEVAIKLYKRHGFEIDSETHSDYAVDGIIIPQYEMTHPGV